MHAEDEESHQICLKPQLNLFDGPWHDNQPLSLVKLSRSEDIKASNETKLLHKRPYQHNFIRLDLASSRQDNELVTLETASFKRKIRKPLRFEQHWQ